jgi:predicted nucleotidyltransferase
MDMLEKYKEAADKYIAEIIRRKDVIGVMHLGGIARDYADEYSDIDIAVFSYDPIDITLGERVVEKGCIIEVFNVAINEGYSKWDSIQKETYQEGILAYDPYGAVNDFIKKAVYYDDKTRQKNMLTRIFNIAWHGWVYTPFRFKTAHGYYWSLPEELWFMRNNENNAYFVSQISVNLFIELLFDVNYRWCPDYKWRYIKSFNLRWLPGGYKEKIDFLLYSPWDKSTWQDKKQAFQSMLDETIEKVLGCLPDDWYEVIDK